MELQPLEKLQEKVGFCLEHYPHTVNDDSHLLFAIIHHYFPGEIYRVKDETGKTIKTYISTDALKAVKKELVVRIRRKFNVEGKYLPTDPEVAENRRKHERVVKDFIKYN